MNDVYFDLSSVLFYHRGVFTRLVPKIGSKYYVKLKLKIEIPKNIPKRPDLVYKDQWKGWADFLGKEK